MIMIGRREKVGNDIYGVKSGLDLEERLGEAVETGFRHSDYYHRYFHGYTEIRIARANGGYTIKRYYTDVYHVQDCSKRRWILQKIAMLMLALVTVVLYFYWMTRPNYRANTYYPAAIPGLISAPLLVLLAASAVGYAVTGRTMTWWEHHTSSVRILRYSLSACILIALTGMVMLILTLAGGNIERTEMLLSLRVIGVAVAPFLMYLLERNMSYTTRENNVKLPEGEAHLIS